MKKSLLLLLLISIFNTPIAADDDEDPIVVSLATESTLEPLYLVPIQSESSAYDSSYLQKLDQILYFDIQHNGKTYLSKRTSEQDNLAISSTGNGLGNIHDWKKHGQAYVVKAKVAGSNLSALALNVQTFAMKKIDDIPLSGDFSQDRRQIHKLSDAITKALFNMDGIATTKVLYTIKTKTDKNKWISEVWEADYDGGNPRQITKQNTTIVTPVYMPPKAGFTAGSILYTSYQNGQPKIFVASLKDGVGKRLTLLRGNQLMPTVSQQRDKVAFICDITGNPDLFVLSFTPESGTSEKAQQIFAAKQATQGTPTFSPNGKQIAFVSDKDGSPKIYMIDIPKPGTSLKDIKAKQITKRNRESTAPSWSPDGMKLAYCSKTGGERQIWVYDFKTGQEKQVTHGPGNKENPSWAPDSLHLVFNTADTNASELYIISLNESEHVKITSSPGEKRFPNWEPRYK